jgi:hypothetical protein
VKHVFNYLATKINKKSENRTFLVLFFSGGGTKKPHSIGTGLYDERNFSV